MSPEDNRNESGLGTEVQDVAEVLSQSREVIPELTLAMRRQALRSLELDDDRTLHQQVAAVKSDLSSSEHDRDGKLTIDS